MSAPSEHTPTPWFAGTAFEIFGSLGYCARIMDADGKVVAVVPMAANGLNDAAFVLTACNSHDALLAFAKKMESSHA